MNSSISIYTPREETITHARMQTCMDTDACTHTYTHTHTLSLSHTHAHTHACKQACRHAHTHSHTHTHTHRYVLIILSMCMKYGRASITQTGRKSKASMEETF